MTALRYSHGPALKPSALRLALPLLALLGAAAFALAWLLAPPPADAAAGDISITVHTDNAPLTEDNLNGAKLELTLASGSSDMTPSWVATAITTGNFDIHGSKGDTTERFPGVSAKPSAATLSGSTVTITLSYDGTDFDTRRKLYVTAKSAAHNGDSPKTSSLLWVQPERRPGQVTGVAAGQLRVSTEEGCPDVPKPGDACYDDARPEYGIFEVFWTTVTQNVEGDAIQGVVYKIEYRVMGTTEWLPNPNNLSYAYDFPEDTPGSPVGTHAGIWNLTPGRYQVRVTAYTSDGIAGAPSEVATGDLEARPPSTPTTSPNRRASVTVTAADPVAVDEGGLATYTVALEGEPTDNVVITPGSDNADVSTQPASLTFTPDNWDEAQTVTVRASHDDDAANDSATVSHTASGADEYDGIAVDSVTVSVTDDDTAGVTVTPTSLNVPEGGTATYTVSLTAQPLAEVGISLVASGVTVQPTELTFTPGNWSAQTVTVSAADGTAGDTAYITHNPWTFSGSGYEVVSVDDITVTITSGGGNTPPPPPPPQPPPPSPQPDPGQQEEEPDESSSSSDSANDLTPEDWDR